MSNATDAAALAAWVKELRSRTGLTQRALAERCGVTTQYISLVEIGGRCPSRPVLILMQQISDVINMPPPPDCVSPVSKRGRGNQE